MILPAFHATQEIRITVMRRGKAWPSWDLELVDLAGRRIHTRHQIDLVLRPDAARRAMPYAGISVVLAAELQKLELHLLGITGEPLAGTGRPDVPSR